MNYPALLQKDIILQKGEFDLSGCIVDVGQKLKLVCGWQLTHTTVQWNRKWKIIVSSFIDLSPGKKVQAPETVLKEKKRLYQKYGALSEM